MSTIYGILGGDKRNIKLVQLLANENDIVYTYGLEKAEELKYIKNLKVCDTFEEMLNNANCIIGPIPFSKDNTNVNMPYCKNNLTIQGCISKINEISRINEIQKAEEIKSTRKKLIVGQISEKTIQEANSNCEIIDLMKNEELTIFNTIATAEGTIQVIMENTEKILQGMNVLILGFGRVAKVLARKLEGLQMKITCAARKDSDLAWIETYGYSSQNIYKLEDVISKYDVIVNTVPSIVISENELKNVQKEVLMIDLASYPGGIDFEQAKLKNVKAILASGLPGKVAPESSAIFIKIAIKNILSK